MIHKPCTLVIVLAIVAGYLGGLSAPFLAGYTVYADEESKAMNRIHAAEITLVDKEGYDAIKITATGLEFLNPEGKAMSALRNGVLLLTTEPASRRALFGPDALFFRDEEGNPRLSIGPNSLLFSDEKGKPRVALMVQPDPALALKAASNDTSVVIGVLKDEPQISIMNRQRKVVAQLTTNKAEAGNFTLRNENGVVRVAMGATMDDGWAFIQGGKEQSTTEQGSSINAIVTKGHASLMVTQDGKHVWSAP
jgi:hypothetical protein